MSTRQGGSSSKRVGGKRKTAAVEEDGEAVVGKVAEAASNGFDGLDFGVKAFGACIGQAAEPVVVGKADNVTPEGLRDSDEGFESGAGRPIKPDPKV